MQVIDSEFFADKFNITIIKEEETFRVRNEALEKKVARFNLENDDSLRSLQYLLKRWGVFKLLVEAGVKEGDSVKIGDFEFEYLSED